MDGKSCCSPSRATSAPLAAQAAVHTSRSFTPETAHIPGGQAQIGTNAPVIALDEEGPARRKKLKPFRMMTTTVTNAMFAQFIDETEYVTEAQRFGWSFVFAAHLPQDSPDSQAVAAAQWWRRIEGANWREINGPGTAKDVWHADHPAVHLSWHDAQAFAQWAGGRLPSEAEWEHAARGGLGDVPYPWGTAEPDDTTHQPCNIWQGRFPDHNTVADGYAATAPAKSFKANGYGLYNLCGNVWEWTAEPYKVRSLSKKGRAHAQQMRGMKVSKGGSFMCHKSYCYRYRIPARSGTTPDTTTAHQGFRLAFDVA